MEERENEFPVGGNGTRVRLAASTGDIANHATRGSDDLTYFETAQWYVRAASQFCQHIANMVQDS